MSRAYRIEVQEAFSIEARGCDRISSQLKLLPLLSPERLAQIVVDALRREGFTEKGQLWEKEIASQENRKATLAIDPRLGQVVLSAEVARTGQFLATRRDMVMDDPEMARALEKDLRLKVQSDAEQEKIAQQARAEQDASAWLETLLPGIRDWVRDLTHTVSLAALREKAQSMGKVQSIEEDPARRSLTIVLEV